MQMGMAKILIKRRLPKQEMAGDTLRLWDADGSKDAKQIGGFTVVLKYYGAAIELPVHGDDFMIDRRPASDYEFVRIEK